MIIGIRSHVLARLLRTNRSILDLLFLYQAIKNCNQSGEEVILSFAEGDEQRMLLMGLKRFTKGYTINPKEMRRSVAVKLIEENKYCF